MDIKRIDSYTDSRFSQRALDQHGAYTVDGQSYEIEITGPISAVVRGKDAVVYGALIEEFRFHAPHIVKFSDESGRTVAKYPPCEVIGIALESIQPSQFFVDEDKLKAVVLGLCFPVQGPPATCFSHPEPWAVNMKREMKIVK